MSVEQDLRGQIIGLVKEYYQQVHEPTQKSEYVAGEGRINYAGRVFDEREMVNLVNSSLDFWLTSGNYYAQFERQFSAMLGRRFSLLVNSGSSANLVAFSALTSPLLGERRIKKGDEVITVAAGFPTTVNPIIQFGAIPVFVDITVNDGTYNIDVSQLEAALSPKTRAVMVAHTMGNPFDLGVVTEFCKKNKLWLVEDNCDALGSTYQGRMTGTFGDLGTSSFYPPHHLTMGEGGAVYMSNPTLKRAAESFRDWGRDCWCPSGKDNTCEKRFDWQMGTLPKGYDHKYTYSHFGYNLKATEMQAAIGLAQLDKLAGFTQARRANFAFLREVLTDLEDYFILPNATANSEPSWFGFLLTVRQDAGFSRDQIIRHLESKGIQTRLLFAGNLIRHPAYNEMRESKTGFRVVGELTNTDIVATHTFWVGVYPGMRPGMLQYVADEIRGFVKKER